METFYEYIKDKSFPCIGAKKLLNEGGIMVQEYKEMSSQETAQKIWEEIIKFNKNFPTDKFLNQRSFTALFPNLEFKSEEEASNSLYKLMQNITYIDDKKFPCPQESFSKSMIDKNYAFHCGGKSFFLAFAYPNCQYEARKSPITYVNFNRHDMFIELRENNLFDKWLKIIQNNVKKIVKEIHPDMASHGEAPEWIQYSLMSENSKKSISKNTKCPFHKLFRK